MVAPSSGVLKGLIDNIATELDTVDDLRVYKYAASSVSEFPAAIIRYIRATAQSVVAAYWANEPTATYHLEVVILVNMADEEEAYAELEKYVSKDQAASVKALVNGATKPNLVTSILCTRATARRPFTEYGLGVVGAAFWVEAVAL